MSFEMLLGVYLAALVVLGLALGDRAVEVLVEATRDEETAALLGGE